MTNSSLTLTSLDFDTLKQQFIAWMQGQTIFKDYNFNDSATNQLIDLLAYNTFLNAFYLNMTFSEMFLDSAQKLDSVVSHAKELNYLPRSAVSSEAIVNFTANTTGISNPFVIPKATVFVGKNSNGQYSFTTNQVTTYTSTSGSYTITGLPLYEGTYKQDTFVVNTTLSSITNTISTYLITNQNVDLSSLVLTVSQDNGANVSVWSEASSLYGLGPNSTVFFVQAAQNQQYEILFGDGLFGAVPQNGAVITASYRVATGPTADGVSNFTCTVDLGAYNGGTCNLSTITPTQNSTAGQLQESVESIRFTAPRYYAAQERAVSSGDYSALVLAQFGGTIEDCASYGGELLNPKQYGQVAVCLKPSTGTIASNTLKNDILAYLQPLIVVPGRVVITDPTYFYCSVTSAVTYDPTQTSNPASTLQSEVIQTILNWSNDQLGKFNSNFYYTPFCSAIDATDSSILSNDTDVFLINRLTPVANVQQSFTIEYNNAAKIVASDPNETRDLVYAIKPLSGEPVLWTSPFTYVTSAGASYPLSVIRDDNFGNLIVMCTINNIVTILNYDVGSINYSTGEVQINNLITSSYGDYISVYMITAVPDFTVQKEQVILIDLNDVSVTMRAAVT